MGRLLRLLLLFGLAALHSSQPAASPLLWTASPLATAQLNSSAAGWQPVPGLALTVAIPAPAAGTAGGDAATPLLLQYSIAVTAERPALPGGNFLNDRSADYGQHDFVGARLVLDGVPLRASGSHAALLGASDGGWGTLRGLLAAALAPGNHTVAVQWRKWGAHARSWRSAPSAGDGFGAPRTLSAVGGWAGPLAAAAPLGDASLPRAAPRGAWSAVPGCALLLDAPPAGAPPAAYSLAYIVHALPEGAPSASPLAPGDSLQFALHLDGAPLLSAGAAATFSSATRSYGTTSAAGVTSLTLSSGNAAPGNATQRRLELMWRQLGGRAALWASQPSLLDGFASARTLVAARSLPAVAAADAADGSGGGGSALVVDVLTPPPLSSLLPAWDGAASPPAGGAWATLRGAHLDFTVPHTALPSASVLTYSLGAGRAPSGAGSFDATTWADRGALQLRLVVDGVPMRDASSLVSGEYGSAGVGSGSLALNLLPGSHSVALQWRAAGAARSAAAGWLRELEGGGAGGAVLFATVTHPNTPPRVQLPPPRTLAALTSAAPGPAALQEGGMVRWSGLQVQDSDAARDPGMRVRVSLAALPRGSGCCVVLGWGDAEYDDAQRAAQAAGSGANATSDALTQPFIPSSVVDGGAAGVLAGGSVALAGGGLANCSSSLALEGPLAAVNALLNFQRFYPGRYFAGAASLAVAVSDLGNVGSGGALSASAEVAFAVSSVSDAPYWYSGGASGANSSSADSSSSSSAERDPASRHLPGGVSWVVRGSVGSAGAPPPFVLQLGDVDEEMEWGAAAPLPPSLYAVTLSVSLGSLSLAAAPLSGSTATAAAPGPTLTLPGATLQAVNAALRTLAYHPPASPAQPLLRAVFSARAVDAAGLSASAVLPLVVTALPAGPSIVPPAQGYTLQLGGLTVEAFAASPSAALVSVRLLAASGRAALRLPALAIFPAVSAAPCAPEAVPVPAAAAVQHACWSVNGSARDLTMVLSEVVYARDGAWGGGTLWCWLQRSPCRLQGQRLQGWRRPPGWRWTSSSLWRSAAPWRLRPRRLGWWMQCRCCA